MQPKSIALFLALAACGSSNGVGGGDDTPGVDAPPGTIDARPDSSPPAIRTVFVIPLENKADTAIYGNATSAPYINGLFATANRATKFQDELPSLPSEPHRACRGRDPA